MWVSRKDWNELQERVRVLEDATYMIRAPYKAKVGRVVDQIMKHLGISIHRSDPRDEIVKDSQ